MANIKELRDIIEYTSPRQPILLRGPHGMGKSEILKKILQDQGYNVTIIFLGQASDAGDLIGLPHKYEVETNEGKRFVTTFAAPEWFPTDPNAKFGLILDEINRSKAEMRNCIQDLTLNFVLNGKPLPKESRIFAAMNPPTDGYYDVEDLDPSLVDRFNVYDFNPTEAEWLDWARTDGNVHEAVVGFIEKNPDSLDCPPPSQAKADGIYPSRRSWKKVSDNLHMFEELVNKRDILRNQLNGIVGIGEASNFITFLKDFGSGITPALILTKWDGKLEGKIRQLEIQQQIALVNQIAIYLENNVKDFVKNETISKKVLGNLEHFIYTIHVESSAMFFSKLKDDFHNKTVKKTWPQFVVMGNKKLADRFTEIIKGK